MNHVYRLHDAVCTLVLTVTGVFGELDSARVDDVIESRPSRARVVFSRGTEEIASARDTLVHALVSQLVVLVSEGSAITQRGEQKEKITKYK